MKLSQLSLLGPLIVALFFSPGCLEPQTYVLECQDSITLTPEAEELLRSMIRDECLNGILDYYLLLDEEETQQTMENS